MVCDWSTAGLYQTVAGEALAIRVARGLSSANAMDTLADQRFTRGAGARPLAPGPDARGCRGDRLDRGHGRVAGLQREGGPLGGAAPNSTGQAAQP